MNCSFSFILEFRFEGLNIYLIGLDYWSDEFMVLIELWNWGFCSFLFFWILVFYLVKNWRISYWLNFEEISYWFGFEEDSMILLLSWFKNWGVLKFSYWIWNMDLLEVVIYLWMVIDENYWDCIVMYMMNCGYDMKRLYVRMA